MTLKTPWTLIDPTDDGSGILARIVTDAEMGHVAVFESPETARAVVELINRAESAEQERRELEAEVERLSKELLEALEDIARALQERNAEQRAHAETRAKLAEQTNLADHYALQFREVCKTNQAANEALDETRAKLKTTEARLHLLASEFNAVEERLFGAKTLLSEKEHELCETRTRLESSLECAMRAHAAAESALEGERAAHDAALESSLSRACTPAERAVLDAVDKTCEGRNGLPTDQPAWRPVVEAWRSKQCARRVEKIADCGERDPEFPCYGGHGNCIRGEKP